MIGVMKVNTPSMIKIRHLNDKGECVLGPLPQTRKVSGKNHQQKSYEWIHLESLDEENIAWLETESNIPKDILESFITEDSRARLTIFPEGIFIVLKALNYDPGHDIDEMASIRLWIDDNKLISSRVHRTGTFEYIEDRIRHNKSPKSIGEIIIMIVQKIYDEMEETIHGLDDKIYKIEQKLLDDEADYEPGDFISYRLLSINLRKNLVPEMSVLHGLANSELTFLSKQQRLVLKEHTEYFTKLLETLNTCRERLHYIQDERANKLTQKVNYNIYVLSVITVFFLPLTFFTGLLGMNLAGIPGAGSDNSFIFYTLILVVLGLVELWILRKIKWV